MIRKRYKEEGAFKLPSGMGVKCTRSRVWQTFEELVFTASYLWTLTYYLPPSKPRLFFWKMGVILSYLVMIF